MNISSSMAMPLSFPPARENGRADPRSAQVPRTCYWLGESSSARGPTRLGFEELRAASKNGSGGPVRTGGPPYQFRAILRLGKVA